MSPSASPPKRLARRLEMREVVVVKMLEYQAAILSGRGADWRWSLFGKVGRKKVENKSMAK